MSDEAKIDRPGQQDEPRDEIEGHAKKFHANDDGTTDEAEGDDVEAHGHGHKVADKLDDKMD